MTNKVRLKGNESFILREGWIKKGLTEIEKNPKIFSDKDAVVYLGIGSNMVKSLKFYLTTMNLIKNKEGKNNGVELTNLAKIILEYDKYLEDIFTIYLLHLNFVLDDYNAFVANYIFNNFDNTKLDKENIQDQIEEYLKYNNISYSDKSLKDDINSFIKMYTKSEIEDPETDLNSPFSDLYLFKKINNVKINKIKSEYSNLNMYVVYYALIKMLKEDKNNISIESILNTKDSVGKLLNLDKSLLNVYLEEMKKAGLIEINKTAGLDMIYFNHILTEEEIIKEYFNR